MGKVKNKINFTPIGSYIITTCYLEKENMELLQVGGYQPKIKEIQQVISAGPRAEVEIGDWVLIDHQRFTKHVKVKSQIRAGVGGEDMIKEQFVPPFVGVPGADQPYLKISDREIEGTIDDYDKLPEDIKSFMTMIEFEENQERLHKQAEEGRKKFDQEKNKNTKEVESKGPMVITDSAKIKVNGR